MSGLRPERGAGDQGPYAQGAYEADGTFVAAVDQLADPLTDPLPGQHASPWFRAGNIPAGGTAPLAQQAQQGPQEAQEAPQEWYDPEGYQRDWYRQQEPVQGPVRVQDPAPVQAAQEAAHRRPAAPAPADDETVGLRTADTRMMAEAGELSDARPVPPSAGADEPRTGGRAERRRAAKGRGRRRTEATPEVEPEAVRPAAPLSRVEARRAARAAKDSPAVVASRVVGEVFISLGVLMLLFVTYQLWWTNVRADLIAGKETNKIQDEWANGERKPGAFEPGQGFAIMHIPKLDVVAPIAEGIDKEKVLDRGMIGHYGEGKLKTAMPSAKQGNFAVAGHRNTHGEPFRYINKLRPGDPIVVETQDTYYTYEMTTALPQTSPSNVSVIAPVPVGSGFRGPGRYLTLTTCTPEFTSTYRLIVWGKMVDERPRSKGKPDALVG
ncbi:class E sortase [Streptomyces sp. NBC_00234]|uniref:class E sortase n=1 Tax=Streptomyces sp. NBC_00234 TaxID=2903638 RepID=UPI002E2D8864|nr:class E sortase [Streptomyces sp. NBC_00234]